MWICPNCGRKFKRTNQTHGCRLINKESLFEKRPPVLKKLYEKIVKEVNKLGKYREETVPPDVIFFKTESSFLEVKVKKDRLEIVFLLEKIEDSPPVAKYLQLSKHRVAHLVKIDQPNDIDRQLINWIKSSYKLVTPAKTKTGI